ncbi:hypothetical protein [Aurantiacibacter aquimixticola]|uniref:Uncharacterized protein n=1 Tax=Aurantiacibacter aquimixticola TaxID=1958945 RepID=A0A419RTC1_9SPHN|nr:hypothetical protein [Aurantiacibacter aquimixticola]RJY09026.1 hypothetical protein D6201_06305 [Aurantiacibacter aquimixticola]
MTEPELQGSDKNRKLKKTLFAITMGGITGFFGAMLVKEALDSGKFASVGASVEIASLVGMIYLITGLFVGLGSLAPNAGAKVLNVEDADELREQRAMLLYSSVGMFAAGLALILVALAEAGGPVTPGLALLVYGVLAVVAIFTSVKSWKQQDELMRAVGRETASLSYYLMLLVGGTWALLAHLAYLPAAQPLDWLTMFWSLFLLATFIVVGRRGMLNMR